MSEATADTDPKHSAGAPLATPLLLILSVHVRQVIVTAAGLAAAAFLSGRDSREVALVFATVLVGQSILGWHNDIVDAEVDDQHRRRGKPLSDGRLDPGTVWFTIICAVLVLIPLSVSGGLVAGVCYLASVAVGMVGNIWPRRNVWSFVPWAISFALYPFFLSYGGWGGLDVGSPPQPIMVVLAALLGIGVHFFWALWGLVADHEDGWTYLPLKLGLKVGATWVMVITLVYLVLVVGAMAWAGQTVGLSM